MLNDGPITPDQHMSLATRILESASLDGIRDDILAPLCTLVGARSAVFLSYSQDRMGVLDGVTTGLPEESLTSYSSYYFQKDPIFQTASSYAARFFKSETSGVRKPQYAGRMPSAIVEQLTRLPVPERFEQTEYYNDFLCTFDIGEILAIFVPVHSLFEEVMCIGLHRPVGCDPFHGRETARVRPLLPAIRSSLMNFALRGGMDSARTALLPETSPDAASGVAILDAKPALIFANSSAHGALELDRQDQTDQLVHLCTAVRNTNRLDVPVNKDFRTSSGRLLSIGITFKRLPAGQVRFIVSTPAASGGTQGFAERARAMGLSRRETEVAGLLMGGLTNESIAAQMNISFRTVENHLRSIYAKVSVNSRTQLLARLVSSS